MMIAVQGDEEILTSGGYLNVGMQRRKGREGDEGNQISKKLEKKNEKKKTGVKVGKKGTETRREDGATTGAHHQCSKPSGFE